LSLLIDVAEHLLSSTANVFLSFFSSEFSSADTMDTLMSAVYFCSRKNTRLS